MKTPNPKILNFTLSVLVCGGVFVSTGNSLADEPNDYLHSRTYCGVLGTSISVDSGGLLSGKNYSRLDGPYEIVLLPALAQNFGFGFFAGHREEAFALELGFFQSNHTASFGPASVTSATVTAPVDIPLSQDSAVYRSVNLDFKRYFFTETQTQPFINIGICFPWMEVSNGAADSKGNFTALTLAGLGLNLGIGMEYYLTPNISLVGAATQRWASFDQFRGFTTQFRNLVVQGPAMSDEGSGLNFTLGTTLGFQ